MKAKKSKTKRCGNGSKIKRPKKVSHYKRKLHNGGVKGVGK